MRHVKACDYPGLVNDAELAVRVLNRDLGGEHERGEGETGKQGRPREPAMAGHPWSMGGERQDAKSMYARSITNQLFSGGSVLSIILGTRM
jgi:hypothetical protein